MARGPSTGATWLGLTGGAAFVAGIAALWSASPDNRWSFALPLVPAVVFAMTLGAGREKGLLGEASVALAFSLAAVPVGVTGEQPASRSLAVGVAFAVIFVLGTLSVPAIVVDTRGGGQRHLA